MAQKTHEAAATSEDRQKRTRLAQTDVPGVSLDQAVRVPKAIVDNYAGGPASPLQVAVALDMTPTSGPFRQLMGASIAYGLTSGGYNAQQIEVTPVGKSIARPLAEGADLVARREAMLRPRVLREFLTKYDNSPVPRNDIAKNVLESMGVPRDKTDAVFELILEGAQSVGFLQEIKNKQFVDLRGASQPSVSMPREDEEPESDQELREENDLDPIRRSGAPHIGAQAVFRRVFITHGKNTAFIEPIKKLLGFGELIPVVSVQNQSVSKPVPDKVIDDMRGCSAAIIHVDAEMKVLDKEANEHAVINPNVLIEIGAAMALYGRRFILLVRDGVTLPSNLQGLYEVRYEGDSLDGNATIRLLEAINDIKNHALPDRYSESSEG